MGRQKQIYTYNGKISVPIEQHIKDEYEEIVRATTDLAGRPRTISDDIRDYVYEVVEKHRREKEEAYLKLKRQRMKKNE